MRDSSTIVRERQSAIRREMDRRGIALKAVAADAGMSYDTLRSYFPVPGGEREPALIPMGAVFSLVQSKALPLDLVSLLLPTNFILVEAPDEFDPEQAAADCHDFLLEKCKSHHPDSEAGPAIGPSELERLRALHVRRAA